MTIKEIKTEEQLQAAFSIRKAVFVEEQLVPLAEEFDEFDQLDANCHQILVYHEGQPVGTGRIRWIDKVGKLERICLLEQYRSLGLGKSIIQELEKIAQNQQTKTVKLHGQTHAEGFYQKLGYKTASEVFMDGGIPHVVMTKTFH